MTKGSGNRGHRRSSGSSEVKGSGAVAGGDGAPEDYDNDPVGGGGSLTQKVARKKPDTGGDGSKGGMT